MLGMSGKAKRLEAYINPRSQFHLVGSIGHGMTKSVFRYDIPIVLDVLEAWASIIDLLVYAVPNLFLWLSYKSRNFPRMICHLHCTMSSGIGAKFDCHFCLLHTHNTHTHTHAQECSEMDSTRSNVEVIVPTIITCYNYGMYTCVRVLHVHCNYLISEMMHTLV